MAALGDADARAKAASTQRNADAHELTKTALVRLDGDARGGTLEVEYFVPGPTWAPSYTVSIDRGAAEIEIRALVVQRTGEDWSPAELVLSTALPQASVELPELSSLRIGRAQPPRKARGYREPPEGADALYADRDAALGPPRTPRALVAAVPAPPPPPPAPAALLEQAIPAGPPPGAPAFAPPIGGAMPLGAPMAAPAPFAAAAPQAAPARQGDLRARLGAATAPPATRAAKQVANAPDEIAIDASALSYAALRMQPGHLVGRGTLEAASAASLYLELLEGRVRVELDVVALVRARVTASEGVALPPRHHAPSDVDGFDFAYPARGGARVPSDGRPHAVLVDAQRAPASMRYVVVPREASDAFRFVTLASPLDAALLRGPADVYVGGRYLLTTDLPSAPPRAPISLGLGVEQSLRVARNTGYRERTTGLMGGGLALEHEIEVDVESHLDEPATIEIRERVPVYPSGGDEIEVEDRAEPAWAEWDQEHSLRGGRRWEVTLAPRAKQTFVGRYVVKIASKHELVGGNRREGT